jgi:hypothetical protein
MNYTLFFSLLTLVSIGCSTTSQTNLPGQRAGASDSRKETGDLEVSFYAMTDAAEVKRTFNTDLLKKGVLPIRLTAENHNEATSFIISKEKVYVLDEAKGATNSVSQGSVGRKLATVTRGDAIGAMAMAGSPLLTLIAAVSASDTVNPNAEHVLSGKEFFTRTIGPGQKAEGFIYFQFQKSDPPSGPFHFVAEVKNVTTGQISLFDLRIILDLKKP